MTTMMVYDDQHRAVSVLAVATYDGLLTVVARLGLLSPDDLSWLERATAEAWAASDGNDAALLHAFLVVVRAYRAD